MAGPFTHQLFSPDNVTIYFLKDIFGRKKAYLTVDEVKSLHVPQYKSLSLDKILEYVSSKGRIDMYLPDDPDLRKVPK